MPGKESGDTGIGQIIIPDKKETQRGGSMHLTSETLGIKPSGSRVEAPQTERRIPGVKATIDPLSPGGMDPKTGKPVRKSDF